MKGSGRERQLSLFGQEPTSPSDRLPVGPAEVAEELEQIAGQLPASIHLGTSSWSFPGWKGLVYDRQASKATLARYGLAAYARHPLLRAVGIDRTFYAPIGAEQFAAYAEVVPDDFRFLVKASSLCTTPLLRNARGGPAGPNELFLHPDYAAEQVVAPFVEGLGSKAGPLLFQFPPLGNRWTRDPARFAVQLGEFLAALPSGPSYAVELRDRELFGPEYFAALDAVDVRHCLNVHPRAADAYEQRRMCENANEGAFIARWMLGSGLGYEQALDRYEPFSELVDEDTRSRELLARCCVEDAAKGFEVVVVANNKAEGSAPLSIFHLAREIIRRL